VIKIKSKIRIKSHRRFMGSSLGLAAMPSDHEPPVRRSGALVSAETGLEQPAALSRDAATGWRFMERSCEPRF
jgi:hypothetical protein